MRRWNGTAVSDGVACGPLYFFRRQKTRIDRTPSADRTAEEQRYRQADAEARRQLDELYRKAVDEAGEEAAMLFEAHQQLLNDPDFSEGVLRRIADGLRAEAAVYDAAEELALQLESLRNEVLRARATDLRDVGGRLVRILSGTALPTIDSAMPVILAADDLAPSETVQLDRKKILAFALSGGTSNGHSAILARTMNIPAVIHMGKALQSAEANAWTWIDGGTGELFQAVDSQNEERLIEKRREMRARQEQMAQWKGMPNTTLDGKNIRLYCNIGSVDDIPAVLENDGRGIGLFRSEMLFLQGEDYPTEDEQFEVYREVVSRMEDKRVIIRTLDIGADKQAPYFKLAHEENPALGFRAIRISLCRPSLFRTQLRAIYRASAYGRTAIMLPMITSVWELQEVRQICASVRAGLEAEGVPIAEKVELGIMIETPAAVMVSDLLAKEVDFFSIGTNDLTQYTLAVDRQGCREMERFFNPHHRAVLRMIRMTVENAHKAGIWVGICGELAGDLELTETFLALGIEELSVAPSKILPLRAAIRAIDTRTAKAVGLE